MGEPENTITDADALIQNMRLMSQIVSEMKEVPVLPSEQPKPNDTSRLDKVEFPEAGGTLTYMEGHPYPYKGFPFCEFVDKIDVMKKIIRAELSGLYHAMKGRQKIQLASLLLVPWLFKDLMRSHLHTFWKLVERFKIKPLRYCTTMRELHRAFSVEDSAETESGRDLRLKLRDFVCMLLEFDNAYRFRFQDVIVFLDKKKFKRSPTKELLRLLDILIARERSQEIKDTWTLVRLGVKFYLPFDRELLRVVRRGFGELNLDLVRLDDGDIHYCVKRQDYTFGFMLEPEWKPPEDTKSLPGETVPSPVSAGVS